MENKHKGPSFEGQRFFVGIDVHLKQWTVVIRTQKILLKRLSMNPSPEQLAAYLNREYPGGTYEAVYEAGFSGFSAQRQLERLGIASIVVHAIDVPSSHKEKERKGDRIDAGKLARELENGSLKGIYIPSEAQLQLRALVRYYRTTVKDCTRIKNRISGLLYFHGINVPEHTSHWPNAFLEELRALPLDGGPLQTTLHLLLDDLVHHRSMQVAALRQLRHHVRERGYAKIISLLRSVPGIGFLFAMIIFTEIFDITRFKDFDHLKSYVGLVPSSTGSDESQRDLGKTMRRNRHLSFAFIEAAWVAVRNDAALLESFGKLSRRMKKQDAIVRIAKKLLSRVRRVWITQEPYVKGVVA